MFQSYLTTCTKLSPNNNLLQRIQVLSLAKGQFGIKTAIAIYTQDKDLLIDTHKSKTLPLPVDWVEVPCFLGYHTFLEAKYHTVSFPTKITNLKVPPKPEFPRPQDGGCCCKDDRRLEVDLK